MSIEPCKTFGKYGVHGSVRDPPIYYTRKTRYALGYASIHPSFCKWQSRQYPPARHMGHLQPIHAFHSLDTR